MRDVAGSQDGVTGDDDARNHAVAQVAGPALLLSCCPEIAGLLGGNGVEVRDAMVDQ